jgi:fatty-acyl-CoA synthase
VVVETRGNGDPASVKRSVTAAVTAEVGLAPADVMLVPFGRLPKTTSGKLRRAEARRRYLAGDYTSSSSRRESQW